MWIFVIIMVLFSIVYVPLYWSAGDGLRRHIGPGFYICFAVTTLAGFIAPGVPYYYAACFLVFVATVRDRQDAICRFVLMAALAPNVTWHWVVGSIFLFDISTIVVLAVAMLFVSLVRNDKHKRNIRKTTAEDGVVLVCFLILSVGYVRFPSFTIILRGFVYPFFSIILLYYAMRKNIRDADDLFRVIGCIAASGVILATFAIYEARFGWSLFGDISGRLGESVGTNKNLLTRGGTLRASATMPEPLTLACYMVMTALAAFSIKQQIRTPLLWAGWCAVVVIGFTMAQSRGNIICLGAGIIGLLFFQGRRSMSFLVAAGAAAGGLAMLALRSSPAQLFGSTGGFVHQGKVYSDYRSLLLERGLEEGAKHRWIGTSIENVYAQLADIKQGQNIVDLVNVYLTFYLTSGLLGLGAFVITLAIVMRKLVRRHNVGLVGTTLRTDRAFVLALLVALLIQFTFMSFYGLIPLMLLFALATARLIGIERDRAVGAARRFPAEGAAQPPSS